MKGAPILLKAHIFRLPIKARGIPDDSILLHSQYSAWRQTQWCCTPLHVTRRECAAVLCYHVSPNYQENKSQKKFCLFCNGKTLSRHWECTSPWVIKPSSFLQSRCISGWNESTTGTQMPSGLSATQAMKNNSKKQANNTKALWCLGKSQPHLEMHLRQKYFPEVKVTIISLCTPTAIENVKIW